MNHLMRRNTPTPSPWYSILLGLNNKHCTESTPSPWYYILLELNNKHCTESTPSPWYYILLGLNNKHCTGSTPSPWYYILLGLNNKHCTECPTQHDNGETKQMSSFDFNINILKCVCQRKFARFKSSTYSSCIIKMKFYLIMEALKKFYISLTPKKSGRILEMPGHGLSSDNFKHQNYRGYSLSLYQQPDVVEL